MPLFEHTRPTAPDLGSGGKDAWAGFRVDDPAEQSSLLGQLRDSGVPVHLSAPQGSALTSRLWSIDAARRQLNFSADAASLQMQALAGHEEAVAVAYLDHVKLQFDLADLLLVRAARSCALRTAWPDTIYRFQRRASYRVRTFERHGARASLRHPSLPDMQLILRIVDISAGGVALSLPDDVPALQPGSSLHGVRIELDGDTRFTATLRLQHVSSLHGAAGGVRLGCEMHDLDGAARRALQRYIDFTQQRRRLLAAKP